MREKTKKYMERDGHIYRSREQKISLLEDRENSP
jgi:hypothetical protein